MITSPDLIGCWFYSQDDLSTIPATIARFTIRITVIDGDSLEFTLHQMTSLAPLIRIEEPYRVAAPAANVRTDIPLPLGWAPILRTHQAAGISLGGGSFSAQVTDDSGLLTFTPLL